LAPIHDCIGHEPHVQWEGPHDSFRERPIAARARAGSVVSQARHSALRDAGTPGCAGHRPSHECRRRHRRLELLLELPDDRAVVRHQRRISEAHAPEARQRTRTGLLPNSVRPNAWSSASVLSIHVGLAPGAVRRGTRCGSGRTHQGCAARVARSPTPTPRIAATARGLRRNADSCRVSQAACGT
jgi:hypothetical protein